MLAVLIAASGCGEDGCFILCWSSVELAPPRTITSVRIDPAGASVHVGDAVTLTALCLDHRGLALSCDGASWSIDPPGHATLDPRDSDRAEPRLIVSGVAPGTATVRFTSADVTGSRALTVHPTLTSLGISPAGVSLPVGGAATLAIACRGHDGVSMSCPSTPTWLSASPGVATVSPVGQVTAITAGAAVLTASIPDHRGTPVSAQVTVTVTPPVLGFIQLDPVAPTVTVGGAVTMSAHCRDTLGAEMTCPATPAWSVVPPGVATISADGTVTATAPGTAEIHGAIGDVSGNTTLVVTTGPVVLLGSIQIMPDAPALEVGSAVALDVACRDTDGAPMTCPTAPKWSITPDGVATVSSSGTLTAIAPGTAIVEAMVSSFVVQANVTVVPRPMASVDLAPEAPTLAIGAVVPMTVTCRNTIGEAMVCPSAPMWNSSPLSVATVSMDGVVTGVSEGTATVTATVGSFSDQTLVKVTGPARLAYALANEPAAASYTPDVAYQFNGLGGDITVTRTGVGSYTVTIPGFGGMSGESRMPFVAAVNAAAVTCLATSWTMIGVIDATVTVACTDDVAASPVDSRFTILALGQSALPGRFGFGHTGPTAGFPPAGASIDLDPASSWSSGGQPVRLMTDGIVSGRFHMGMQLAAVPGQVDVIALLPAGTPDSRCQTSLLAGALQVECFPFPGAARGAAPFAGLVVDEGRANQRFGSAAAASPDVAEYPAPEPGRRNSAGGDITLRNVGTGRYEVVFGELARQVPADRETVFVTASWLVDRVTCRVEEAWSTSLGRDLTVKVACADASGVPANRSFLVFLVE